MYNQIDNEPKKSPTFNASEEEKRKYYDRIARQDALISYSGYYIYEENKKNWIENVINNLDELEVAGKIISSLGRGETVEEASKYITDDLKPEYLDFTLKTVLQYSKRGPEFFRATCDVEGNRKVERAVRKIEKRNAKYQRNEEKRNASHSF